MRRTLVPPTLSTTPARCLSLVSLALALLLVSGCATIRDWTAEDTTEEPAELTDFEAARGVDVVWSRSVGNGTAGRFLKLAPLVTEDRVVAVEAEGEVMALDRASGETLWATDLEAGLSSGAGGDAGLVAVGSGEGGVYALDGQDGTPRWQTQVTGEVLSAPQVGGATVVVRSLDGRIAGLSSATGERRWVFQRPVPVLTLRGTSRPLIYLDAVFAGMDGGTLVALTLEEGRPAWETTIAEARGRSELDRMVDIDGDPVRFERGLYAVAYQGRVAAVDMLTGRMAWAREMSSSAGLGVDRDNVYVTDEGSDVWALARTSGASVWKQDALHARSLTAPVPQGDAVVVGDLDGYLHWLSREDGRLLARHRVAHDPILAAPVVYDDVLYVSAADGTLEALRLVGAP
jgi:outer membrane protein assembly factor BamB